MTIHLEFDANGGILRARFGERFDMNEYREALVKITSGIDYPATVSTIWDLRKLDFTNVRSYITRRSTDFRYSPSG